MVKEIKVDLPYPEIGQLEEDFRSASIISPAYAGLNGELSAILLYTYQTHYFNKYIMQEVAEVLEGMSINEMRHFEILGKLILALGVEPVYTVTLPHSYAFYNTGKIPYSNSIESMILQSISGELKAIEDYEYMLKRLANKKVEDVISRIILDEKLHVTVLTELLEKVRNCK